MFLQPEPETQGRVVTRAPGERDEATTVLPPAPAEAAPQLAAAEFAPLPDEIACRRCAHRNPQTRVRCERCGDELRPPQPVATLPPLPPPGRSHRRLWLILAAVLVAGAVAAGTVLIVRELRDDPAGTADDPASVALVRIDPRTVRASASSTSPDPVRYGAANTLDGNHATAWHSHGEQVASNVGVSLTYRFARPVRLARITLVNGFARSPVDYRNNERAARFLVRSDSGSRRWELQDTSEPQTLDLDGRPTAAVAFVVEAVYPGIRYEDVTITEVAFDARP